MSTRILSCIPYEMYNSEIVSAQGCRLLDRDGKEYLDFESGVWCLGLGHNPKDVTAALMHQIEHIGHVGYRYSNPIVESAAELLLGVLGMADGKSVFLSSGSEAVELALQAAKRVAKGQKILFLQDAYLSAYGATGNRSGDDWWGLDLSGIKTVNDTTALLAKIPFEDIGVFMFEPGNASGTAKLPPVQPIQAIVSRLKHHGALIVVDEVTTGMGRTGKWFGFEHYGIVPDIVACGKGLGNGFPVSAVAFSYEIAEQIELSGFRYAQSHQNDPLACAVAYKVIEIMRDQNIIDRSRAVGAHFRLLLESLQKKHPCIAQVNGIGLMLTIELGLEAEAIEQIGRRLYEAGYIVGVKSACGLLRFYPPLIIEQGAIERLIDILDELMSAHACLT